MANPTPVRQHVLNALAAGFKYEQDQARQASKQNLPEQASARIARAYLLARAHERVQSQPRPTKENL